MLDNAWYIDDGNNSSTGWWAVTAWSNNGGAGTAYTAGVSIVRQSGTPTVGNERVYICVISGTGGTGADPLTTFTRGVVIASGGATFQECTGVAAINGDLTNTPTWAQMRANSTTATLGQVIQRNNGASYQICTVSGTVSGSEPAFSNTAGTATTDNAATWRSLGAVGNFTTIFAAPHARLANAFAANWGAAGNSFFIHNTSAETQASAITLAPPGTSSSPNFIYSVGTGAVPPTSVTAGASISTSGANSINLQSSSSYALWEGITFSAGSAASLASLLFANANSVYGNFRNCSFTIGNTNSNSRHNIYGGGSGVKFDFYNPTFTFGSATGQAFTGGAGSGVVNIVGGSVAVGANVPTNLFLTGISFLNIIGMDLSAIGSGKTLVAAYGNNPGAYTILQDCKLNASVTVAAAATTMGQRTYVIRSDSSGTNYRHEIHDFVGDQTIETTIIRTGGASDGTTGIAWKVVTTANSRWAMPFVCVPIQIKNATTGSNVTVTVYGIWGGGAVPNNDDIWMDVEYLGSASTPLATINSVTKASNLATGSAWSTDSSSWGGSTTPFKMTVTLSSPQPAQKGYFFIYVKCAKAGTTFYIDPLAVLS